MLQIQARISRMGIKTFVCSLDQRPHSDNIPSLEALCKSSILNQKLGVVVPQSTCPYQLNAYEL